MSLFELFPCSTEYVCNIKNNCKSLDVQVGTNKHRRTSISICSTAYLNTEWIISWCMYIPTDVCSGTWSTVHVCTRVHEDLCRGRVLASHPCM